MWIYNMPYSDRIIMDTIKTLEGHEGITVTRIAESAHVSFITTKRALNRLESVGKIIRTGKGRRWGHTYRIADEI